MLNLEPPVILVVGSTMIDMVVYADQVPAPGETVVGNSFALGFGGKGANQAVMARRLGADVALVSCVGDDVFADLALANLGEQGIDTRHTFKVHDVSSGVAPIWVESDGTNRVIVIPGANDHLPSAGVETAVASFPRLDVVVGQFEVPQEATAAGFAVAQDRGAVTILNPAPAMPVREELLQVSDWLVPNEVEFKNLAQFAGLNWDGRDVPDWVFLELEARLGVRLVVTLGESGAVLVAGDRRVRRVMAPPVDAVDTTGAGDAFVGTFACALAAGVGEEEAVRLSCKYASQTVRRMGTQTSFPPTRSWGNAFATDRQFSV